MANLPAVDEKLVSTLGAVDHAFVLTNPRLKDNPIIYASEGFYTMTGYSAEETLGRNCRFLQGPETSRRAVGEIRDAVREERPAQMLLLNYKKDGTPFWNLFYTAPVFGSDQRVINYIGIQTELSEDTAMELFDSEDSLPESLPAGDAEHLASNLPELQGSLHDLVETEKANASEIYKMVASGVASTYGSPMGASGLVKPVSSSLLLPLTQIQQAFVLSDPSKPDNPIIYASPTFLELCGYEREEVVGRNCRFLQGPETDMSEVAKVREAVAHERPVTVRLLNYRKDGARFWNSLHVCPVRNAQGKVAFYCGVQLDVSMVSGVPPGAPVGMKERIAHNGVVGTVRVAVRSLQGGKGGSSEANCGLRRTASTSYETSSSSSSLQSSSSLPVEV